MCNRYVSPEEAEIERFWHIGRGKPNRWWKREVFPRDPGPFVRLDRLGNRELAVGQWALIPPWAKAAKLPYSTNNARSEELESKPAYKSSWAHSQRCIIPVAEFYEPNWETGKNVWWSFRRSDGQPWGLAGLWNTWTDRAIGEVHESYTMLTLNADAHPIMSRMHKADPRLSANRQDKRSVVAIEMADVDEWLSASPEEARRLIRLPEPAAMIAEPEHT